MIMPNITMIYADLIIDGLKTFKQAPKNLKAKVKEVLIRLGMSELAVEE